ncbi:phosphatase [Alsobacter soli]|uniref:Phosphatase n=1 Tax=Alsobacter soli TaxID=2109933 RepID=A0A2T1HV68_9HYPH|nr:HAD-IB family phosphatase [Alsobacter soli]PSC05555.1 phosphatase [Alsobacter soli]
MNCRSPVRTSAPSLRILCDFDGTVTRQDVTDALLEAWADPTWTDVEELWTTGAIGSRECLTRQVSLLRGEPSDIDAVIDGIEVEVGFREFVAYCALRGFRLEIVSDGLDYAIRRILERLDLTVPFRANGLTRDAEGDWALQTPHADSGCAADSAHCKCRSGVPFQSDALTVVIGDGRSDICLAGSADLVFAKEGPSGPSTLLRHMRAHRRPVEPFTTFFDVVAGLERCFGAAPRILEGQAASWL